ncbi:MAG: hypothetical protein JW955_06160 [Sedimentisphaerales bacterium]|nr:hypothetical protein [Sedimentisphaerales bacterium]
MDKESKGHHLRPEKLARLWDIGSDVHIEAADSAGAGEERYAELLHDWLARQLPPDPVQTQDLVSLLPEALGQICQEVRPFSGDSIGFLLTHADTDVQVLRRIKDYAKELGAPPAGEVEREVALAVYFAAIAAALVSHETRISQHGDARLRSAFEALSERNAVPSELRSLFRKACRRSP